MGGMDEAGTRRPASEPGREDCYDPAIVQPSHSTPWLPEVASIAASAAFLLVSLVVLAGSSPSGLIAGFVLANGAFVALVSIGLTLVLRAGRLDLSVAAVAALGGLVAARVEGGGQALIPGLAVAVAVGAGFGLVNGLVGSLSRTAAVVASIGTAAVAQMLAFQTSASPIRVALGADDPGRTGLTANAVLLVLLLSVAVTVLLTVTPVRAWLDTFADDGRRPGVLGAVLVVAFVCSGALAALTGVLDAAWLGAAEPLPATDLLMEAIAAALIGGSALRGGSGTGPGAVVASFAIAALLTALSLRGVSGTVLLGVAGGLVVVAVLLSEARSRLRR